MLHETGLITTIVAGLVLAFIFGAIANRLRMPPLVGYLIAGIVAGPYSPGFVADASIASQLAEIGVILLMFGVGLNFSLKDLLSVQAIAIPGALGRIIGATVLGMGLGLLMGWTIWAGLLFGLALSVASTVVLLKALQDRHLIDTDRGRIAVGWVIVEDIAMVLALVLIPAFAGLLGGTVEAPSDPFVSLVERLLQVDVGLWGVIGITVVKLAAFVGVMLVVGRRLIPLILHYTAHTGSRELFRLAVLAVALGVAAGASYLFGVSLALGAFFAGMILSESELSHRAAQESLPLRDAFAVLFFVSVGMLFDPMILLRDPLPVLATLFIIVIGKSVVAFLLIVAFKRSAATALSIAASLAQIGEFSFILAALGVSLGILPAEGRDLILAGALLSIVINPLLFWIADRLRPRLEVRFAGRAEVVPHAEPAAAEGSVAAEIPVADRQHVPPAKPVVDDFVHPTVLTGHIILVGYGRVGRVVGEGLLAARAPFLVIEDADTRVAAAKAAGIEVVVGNAAGHEQLELANVAGARQLVVAIPNAFEAGQATEQARRLNPAIRIIARAHSDEEEEHLKHLGADTVIMGEREIGLGMLGMLGERGRAAATAPEAEPAAAKLAPAENIVASAIAPAVGAAMAAEALSLPEDDVVVEAPPAAEDDLEGIGLEPSGVLTGTSPEVAPSPPESEVAAKTPDVVPEPVIVPDRSVRDAELAAQAAVESTPAADAFDEAMVEPAIVGLAATESGLAGPAAVFPVPEPELPPIAAGPVLAEPEAPAAEVEPVVSEPVPVQSPVDYVPAIADPGAHAYAVWPEREAAVAPPVEPEAPVVAATDDAWLHEAAQPAEPEAPAVHEAEASDPSPALAGDDAAEEEAVPATNHPVPPVTPEDR